MVRKRNISPFLLAVLGCLLMFPLAATDPPPVYPLFATPEGPPSLPEFDDSYGVVFRDMDGDGQPDLYVTRFRNLNRFFVNRGAHGGFQDQTIASGLGGNLEPRGLENLELGACSADLNNDGKQEILIIGWGQTTRLFTPQGDGSYADVTRSAGLETPMSGNAAAVADVDLDGDLDLFITDEHGPNHLFLQTGNLQFQEVSAAWGLRDTTISQDATFTDLNGDFYPDLYVCNWRHPDRIYLNDQGRGFIPLDLDWEHGRESYNSNDAVFFDYDNDGDLDLYVTDRHGRSRLYERQAGEAIAFRPVSRATGLENFYPCYSILTGDVDNNGWSDVYFANLGPNLLYLNEGGHFTLVYKEGLSRPVYSTGGGLADVDGDGDLDVFVAHKDTTSRLYINPGARGRALRVHTEGVRSNRDGIGALVRLYADENHQPGTLLAMAERGSTSGYLSQSEATVHFGLPPGGLFWVEVLFPSAERRLEGPFSAGETVWISEYDGWRKGMMRFYQGAVRRLGAPDFWWQLGLYAALLGLVLFYTGLLLKRYQWRFWPLAGFGFGLFLLFFFSQALLPRYPPATVAAVQILLLLVLGAVLFGFLERIRQLTRRRYGYRKTLLAFSDQLILLHDNETLAEKVCGTLAQAFTARHTSFWLVSGEELTVLATHGPAGPRPVKPLDKDLNRRLRHEILCAEKEPLQALFGPLDFPAYLLGIKNETALLALILLQVDRPLEAEDRSLLGVMANQMALTLVNNAFIAETRKLERQVAEAEVRRATIRLLEKKNAELNRLYGDLKETQNQLIHSEKMSSLGQLVAGIAHELNNPIGYIYANMQEMNTTLAALPEGEPWPPEVDQMIADSLEGSRRLKRIVTSLQKFSRLAEEAPEAVDIHQELETTLSLMKHEFKAINITKNYATLPPVTCQPGQMNQVFMNIILNAVQALEGRGEIHITTAREKRWAVIRFQDNGPGISPRDLGRIFDPFFTTKPVGMGTGLGLSISYGIVKNQGGALTVDSTPGAGATFTIRLPLQEEYES